MSVLPENLARRINSFEPGPVEDQLPQLYQLAQRYPASFQNEDEQVSLVVTKARSRFFDPQEPAVASEPADLPALIEESALAAEIELSGEQRRRAEEQLDAELHGIGVLQPLLETPGVTDIYVNGPGQVWMKAGATLTKTAVTFPDEDAVRALATRIITAAGARLDEACPAADVHTTTGLRVHAVLPPLSRAGTVLSIRVQPVHRMNLTALAKAGLFDADVHACLRYLVAARKNFLISGGTGTGKTTLLNAMLSETPPTERIVTIEDSPELEPVHPHVVSLQTRPANAEGHGEVTLTELIRQALRMHPTRLVLGECRGAEVLDMLTAMNTGHSGTGATVHANSADAVPSRLYAMGAMAGLSQEATALQAATAVDYVIHIVHRAGTRQIAEISRITTVGGHLLTEPLCTLEQGRRRSMMSWTSEGKLLLETARASVGES